MTTPTDRPNLDRLRELDKAATPGPWHVSDNDSQWIVDAFGDVVADTDESDATWTPSNDAALIAAYRNATPALVSALTDVLALAERLSHGNLLRADYSDGLKDAAEQIRRAITNHVTPDAPASEATETKD